MVVLHHYLDMPLDEVAETLGVPVGTVRSRLHHAMRGLRAALEADARPTAREVDSMSTDRDVTRIVRSWLEEGATALPDRVLDAVLDQVPATPQRRPWWPAWRINEMNNVGSSRSQRRPSWSSRSSGSACYQGRWCRRTWAQPDIDPTRLVADTDSVADDRVERELRRQFRSRDDLYDRRPMLCSLADDLHDACHGLVRVRSHLVGKNVAGGGDVFDLYFSPHLVGNVYTGGCHWLGTALTPPVGPTVDDLATALSAQAGPGAAPPVAVTVDGHPGKKVELSIPQDLDVTTCDSDGDFTVFGRWLGTGQSFGAAPWTYGNGQHNTVYIIDVDGDRQVIDTMYLPGTTAADLAELDQIVASIRFETAASSPSAPSPSP